MSDERTRRLRELVYGLAEQQAMADDWWRPKLAAIEAETGVLLAGLLQELSTHRHIMHDQEWVPFGAIESAFHRAVLDTEGDRQAYIPTPQVLVTVPTVTPVRATPRPIADTEGDASPAPRPETGPMQFGDDWPGLFIRGDNALGYSLALNTAIDATKDPLTLAQLRSLRSLLVGCDVRNSPEVQHARIVPLPDPPVQP